MTVKEGRLRCTEWDVGVSGASQVSAYCGKASSNAWAPPSRGRMSLSSMAPPFMGRLTICMYSSSA